jgi:hypothetical protein
MEDGVCLPQQLFTVNETCLFWKKMPRRIYIIKDEITLSGHTTVKDMLNVLLCFST